MAGPNTSPIFTLVPNVGFARLAAANTARDGSGTVTTIFTAGTEGSLLNKITLHLLKLQQQLLH